MNPDEMKMMPKTDCIISLGNSRPIYAKKIVYYTDPVFAKRANWTLPDIPVLDIRLDRPAPAATPKAVFVSPEEMDSFHWSDAANAEELARAILSSIIPPDSPPDYIAALMPALLKNWGEDSLPFIRQFIGDSVQTA